MISKEEQLEMGYPLYGLPARDKREETIARWQTQFARAAGVMSTQFHQMNHDERMVYTFLDLAGRSPEISKMLYDFGNPEYGPPEPDWEQLKAVEVLRRILDE